MGSWAGYVGKAGSRLEKLGKGMGLASDLIGFAKDFHGMASAKSPELKYDKFVSTYASALIVAGGALSSVTPWGIAAQVVGLGIKLLREETSEAYDASYGTLKEATKTPAERAAELAAIKADREQRNERGAHGNRF